MKEASRRQQLPRSEDATACRAPMTAPAAAPSPFRISLVNSCSRADWEHRRSPSRDQRTLRKECFAIAGAACASGATDASAGRRSRACWPARIGWTTTGSSSSCRTSAVTSWSCSASSASCPNCWTVAARRMSRPFSTANCWRCSRWTKLTGDSVRVGTLDSRSRWERRASEYRNSRRQTRATTPSTGSCTAQDYSACLGQTTSMMLWMWASREANHTDKRRRTSVGLSPKSRREKVN